MILEDWHYLKRARDTKANNVKYFKAKAFQTHWKLYVAQSYATVKNKNLSLIHVILHKISMAYIWLQSTFWCPELIINKTVKSLSCSHHITRQLVFNWNYSSLNGQNLSKGEIYHTLCFIFKQDIWILHTKPWAFQLMCFENLVACQSNVFLFWISQVTYL